ncbi:UDP-galactopyranose mutase [Lachnospiraceae bacterium KM106-2]|nr:UDP-galactopyranose mutase [Lachnospiraceae bacterium KM106-2]
MVNKLYNSIIVGTGLAGAVMARKLAEERNEKVLIIDKRSHIGGNCYDEYDSNGVLIHTYGPHIFHTSEKEVFEFLSRFTEWIPYKHKVMGNIYGTLVPIPFNLNSIDLVYDKEKAEVLKNKLVEAYGLESSIPILELLHSEDSDIVELAKYVYENVFLKYTMKQWNKLPEEIDQSVTKRVPVVISYHDGYFHDTYEGMPKDGYTKLFEQMLTHPNITVLLDTDLSDMITFENTESEIYEIHYKGEPFTGKLIYTGPVDELFDHKYGQLPYRSLDFKFEQYDKPYYQSAAVVNYTVSEDFTRITEFKYMTGQSGLDKTTILKEYPKQYQGNEDEIPYYPIDNEENLKLYHRYVDELKHYDRVYLLGRLAEYKYYNMDAIVKKALLLEREII